MTAFLSMLVFTLIGAITPGPVNLIATGSGASFGFGRTLPHVAGASLGYALVVLLVGAGLHRLLENSPWIMHWLRYIGAAYMLYLAWKMAGLRPVRGPEAVSKSQSDTKDFGGDTPSPPSFWQGALCQWLNPKAWLFAMSGISLFVITDADASLPLVVFCAISLLVCFASVALWAAMGQIIRRYLSRPGRQALFNRLMGSLLAVTVLVIFLLD